MNIYTFQEINNIYKTDVYINGSYYYNETNSKIYIYIQTCFKVVRFSSNVIYIIDAAKNTYYKRKNILEWVKHCIPISMEIKNINQEMTWFVPSNAIQSPTSTLTIKNNVVDLSSVVNNNVAELNYFIIDPNCMFSIQGKTVYSIT